MLPFVQNPRPFSFLVLPARRVMKDSHENAAKLLKLR